MSIRKTITAKNSFHVRAFSIAMMGAVLVLTSFSPANADRKRSCYWDPPNGYHCSFIRHTHQFTVVDRTCAPSGIADIALRALCKKKGGVLDTSSHRSKCSGFSPKPPKYDYHVGTCWRD